MLLVVLSCVTSFWRELFYMESYKTNQIFLNLDKFVTKMYSLSWKHRSSSHDHIPFHAQFNEHKC